MVPKEIKAEIVGMSFGDGSLTKRKTRNKLRYQLRGDSSQDREHFDTFIIPTFNKYIGIPFFGRNVSVVESKKSHRSYGISIESNTVCNELKLWGIPEGVKDELHIPDWINSKTLKINFLRGLLDTDGSVFCQKNYSWKPDKHVLIRMKVTTTSKILMKKVKELVNELDIKCNFYEHVKKSNRNAYSVEIYSCEGVKRWFEIVGSNSPKHSTKFEVWSKFGYCSPRTTIDQRYEMLSMRET